MSFGNTPLYRIFLQRTFNREKASLIQPYAQIFQMQLLMFQFTSDCTAVINYSTEIDNPINNNEIELNNL